MLKGKPKKQIWSTYETCKFNHPKSLNSAECGAFALHAITGNKLSDIMKLSKFQGHWSNKMMFSYLKKYNYKLFPVTLGNIIEGYSSLRDKNILSMNNVLLLDQKIYRGMNSWSVLYHNILAHSGDVKVHDTMDLINYPVQAIYLVWHNKWK